MTRYTTAQDIARLFAGLLVVVATGCSAAAPEEELDESVGDLNQAVGSDPCEGQPDSYYDNRYGIYGYACAEGDWCGDAPCQAGMGYHLLYCWGGATQTQDCAEIGRYCRDYTTQYPGSAAVCEDGGW